MIKLIIKIEVKKERMSKAITSRLKIAYQKIKAEF